MFQQGRTRSRRGGIPRRLCGHGVLQGLLHRGVVRGLPVAHHFAAVGWICHRDLFARGRCPRHQWCGRPAAGTGGIEGSGKVTQLVVIGKIDAHGIVSVLVLAAVQIDRQRDAGMLDVFKRGHELHRVADQLFDRNAFVSDAVDEAGVGAVFQQAAHQIRQQVFVAAHRRVHAAGHIKAVFGDHFGIQVIAHAVQFLEFKIAAAAHCPCHPMHGGNRLRIVGGKHRVDRVAVVEQAPRIGQIRHVGILLASEQRVAGLPIHLRALDFGIPIRAFDQPHGDAPVQLRGHLRDVVDDERGALLIGLHHDAKAVPAAQRTLGHDLKNQVQRELQPVGFFGIDGQTDAVAARQLRQLQQAATQLVEYACALGVLVARMQGGEFDRDAGRGKHIAAGKTAIGAGLADGVDGGQVCLLIAQRILRGQCAFAEHVEGIAVIGEVALARTRQGLVNRAAQHELMAHDLHRLAHRQPDHGLTGASHQALERAMHIALGVIGQINQFAGQHQAPGRGIDQHRIGLAQMFLPVGIGQFVANQRVGGGLVGNAQQRFGHAHQQHAFLTAEVVLAHEGFNHALMVGTHADPAHQIGGHGLCGIAVGVGQGGLHQQFAHMCGFVADPAGGNGGAWGRRGRVQLRCQNRHGRGRGAGRGIHCAGKPAFLRGKPPSLVPAGSAGIQINRALWRFFACPRLPPAGCAITIVSVR